MGIYVCAQYKVISWVKPLDHLHLYSGLFKRKLYKRYIKVKKQNNCEISQYQVLLQ